MTVLNNNLLLGADATAATYSIPRSLRFNSSDSAYLSRTPASAGTSLTSYTMSMWVKRSALGGTPPLFSAGTDTSNYLIANFQADDTVRIVTGEGVTNNNLVYTSAVFRDTSAWYHLVFQFDFANATSTDRIKLYVNGSRLTLTGTFAAQNYTNPRFNGAFAHSIGKWSTGAYYFDGYLADIYFIDGQALTPTSFGQFDTNGVWQPIAYSGTYGTNGFHLPFSDNSAATATTLGKDTSGNGNNWTPNNLSVTAGAGNDSLVDSPTNGTASSGADTGGVVVGNYATLNPLAKIPFGSGTGPLANGNLELVGASAIQYVAVSTIALTTNVYAEFIGATQYLGLKGSNDNSYYIWFGSNFDRNGTTEAVGVTYSSTDVVGIAFNSSTLALTFYKNGTFQYTKTIASGEYVFLISTVGTGNCVCNFGQRPFAYAAPAGFKSLNTANLPTPVVAKPNTVMDVKLITANNSTQTISGFAFSPDLVWTKSRSQALSHYLYDTVRGVQKPLSSNGTGAESTITTSLTAFNSDGFTVGPDDAANYGVGTGVAWCWDAGSSTVTNTAGTISSQVRANPSAGFSVVTWTQGSAGANTIGHGLGVAPQLVIVKSRSLASEWAVYHASLGATKFLKLNTTDAVGTLSAYWNDTPPTSTVFSVGSWSNLAGNNVAYCFAPVSGYSAFGSITANGTTDGPFAYLGFRSRFLLYKNASNATGNWGIFDSARSTGNVAGSLLLPNTSNAEFTSNEFDLLSNGIKLRYNYTNGEQIIFAAFAENPFSIARAR